MDMTLPGTTGIDVCAEIRHWVKHVRFVGMTAYNPSLFSREAAAVGIEIIVRKQNYRELPLAVRQDGRTIRGPEECVVPRRSAVESLSIGKTLSPRELEILSYYAQGASTQDIVKVLHMTKGSVRSYEERALKKLGASNRTQAVAICVRRHML